MAAPNQATTGAPAYEVQYRCVHGYRRAFVKTGAGPALLLIHGIGNDLESFDAVIPELARHHTVVAPDLLGHGRSDKPHADYSVAAYANAMRDLLSVLGIERATIIGHSLGGGVATQFAYQYPERCERLVLVSSGGVSRDVHPILRLATAPGADMVMSALGGRHAQRIADLLLRLSARLGSDLALDREMVLAVFRSLGHATSRRAFVRTLRAAVDVRGQVVTMLDRSYLAVGLPTLLVWGSRDGVIPLEHGRIAQAAMPGSRLEIFDGAGHFPHRADPERFVTLVCDFLKSTQPSAFCAERWCALLRAGRPDGGTDPRKMLPAEVAA